MPACNTQRVSLSPRRGRKSNRSSFWTNRSPIVPFASRRFPSFLTFKLAMAAILVAQAKGLSIFFAPAVYFPVYTTQRELFSSSSSNYRPKKKKTSNQKNNKKSPIIKTPFLDRVDPTGTLIIPYKNRYIYLLRGDALRACAPVDCRNSLARLTASRARYSDETATRLLSPATTYFRERRRV